MKRNEEIQKLRVFALIMACMGHFPFALPDLLVHGYTGVTIFFVISGYVCTLSYQRTLAQYNSSRVPIHTHIHTYIHTRACTAVEFWLSRVFRVLPVIAVWLLVYFFSGQYINFIGGSYGDLVRWFKEFRWWLSGAYNYYYIMSHMPGLFGHFWTLAVEIQFYAFLPLFFAVFRKSSTQIAACIAIIVLSSTVLRFVTPREYIGVFTHTQLDSLFAGVLLCLTREKLRFKGLSAVPGWLKAVVTTALLVALYLLPANLDYTASPAVKYPIFTLLASALVYLAQLDEGWIYGKNRTVAEGFNRIAETSFSIYISHVLLFSGVYSHLYQNYLLPRFPVLLSASGIILQVVALALVCYWVGKASVALVERPYSDYGRKITHGLRVRLTSGGQG